MDGQTETSRHSTALDTAEEPTAVADEAASGQVQMIEVQLTVRIDPRNLLDSVRLGESHRDNKVPEWSDPDAKAFAQALLMTDQPLGRHYGTVLHEVSTFLQAIEQLKDEIKAHGIDSEQNHQRFQNILLTRILFAFATNDYYRTKAKHLADACEAAEEHILNTYLAGVTVEY